MTSAADRPLVCPERRLKDEPPFRLETVRFDRFSYTLREINALTGYG